MTIPTDSTTDRNTAINLAGQSSGETNAISQNINEVNNMNAVYNTNMDIRNTATSFIAFIILTLNLPPIQLRFSG